jgi:hypothetical protein
MIIANDFVETHSLVRTFFVYINNRPLYCFASAVAPRRKTRVFCGGPGGGRHLVTTDNSLTPFVCWIESLTSGYWRYIFFFCSFNFMVHESILLLVVCIFSIVFSPQDRDRNVSHVFRCPVFIFCVQLMTLSWLMLHLRMIALKDDKRLVC